MGSKIYEENRTTIIVKLDKIQCYNALFKSDNLTLTNTSDSATLH